MQYTAGTMELTLTIKPENSWNGGWTVYMQYTLT